MRVPLCLLKLVESLFPSEPDAEYTLKFHSNRECNSKGPSVKSDCKADIVVIRDILGASSLYWCHLEASGEIYSQESNSSR